MTPEHWQRVKELFQSAAERDASQRAAFLDEVCAGDPPLRKQIEALIASHEGSPSFLERPAFEVAAISLADDQADSVVGRRIGAYKILREVGHGGMGAVYIAARSDDEYQKRVAIKLVKRGMDTEAVLRRFRNERQILADLDHPNIAKLLDGGTTEEGLPYFIMDYVEGLPIDVYCDKHKMPTAERLKLFRIVCSAVQFAHQKLVVHRDLKPSNILVSAEGVPKLLDFGIAKLLNPELSAQMLALTSGLQPMTPEYASPEQVRGEPITAASDVYSLGVLLYELLTGHRPYRLRGHTLQEIERIICEEEPGKPSTVISRVEEMLSSDGKVTLTPESVSNTRDGRPEKLRRQLSGDMDNVVLMALRKETERRYGSVEQFSEDVRRHLEGLPVVAHKDTLGYRSAKFIKRNKPSVIMTTLFSAVLIALLTAGLYLLPQRDSAAAKTIGSLAVLPLENLSGEASQDHFADGMTEALIADLGKIGALRVISPTSVMQYKGTRKPLTEIARQLNVDAIVQGSVRRAGDLVRMTVWLIHPATDRQLWSESYTRDLRYVLALQSDVARAIAGEIKVKMTQQEQARLTKARPVHREAYDAYSRGRYHWNKRTDAELKKAIKYFEQAIEIDPTYALAHAGLADCYGLFLVAQYGALPPREAARKAEDAALKALDKDDTLAEAHTALGSIRHRAHWDWPGAERDFKRAIELNPNYPTAYQSYAVYLASMGRQEEALNAVRRAQELEPLSLVLNAAVGRQLYFARQYDQALEHLQRTLELDPHSAVAHFYLGQVYEQKGIYEKAIAELSKARSLSDDSPLRVAGLGHAYALSGRRKEALEMLDELKKLSRRRYVSPYHRAVIYSGLEDKDQALEWLQRAYDEREGSMVWLKVEPMFDPIRSEPQFAGLLRRIGLPP
jgi:eukaryotic-like serine/threonine-protein kinase